MNSEEEKKCETSCTYLYVARTSLSMSSWWGSKWRGIWLWHDVEAAAAFRWLPDSAEETSRLVHCYNLLEPSIRLSNV